MHAMGLSERSTRRF